MSEKNNGLQTAVNTARTAKAAGRIAKAAAVGGLEGAALATAKEKQMYGKIVSKW